MNKHKFKKSWYLANYFWKLYIVQILYIYVLDIYVCITARYDISKIALNLSVNL